MNERIFRTRVAAVGARAAKVVERAAAGEPWTVAHVLRAAEWLKTGDRAGGLTRAWPALAARLKTIAAEAEPKPAKAARNKKEAAAPAPVEAPVPDEPVLDATAVPDTVDERAPYTMTQLAEDFLKHLEVQGKARGTVFSYSLDLGIGIKHFGADRDVRLLSVADVVAFNASDTVTKTRGGAPKADVSIAKTRRVLRLALEWAASDARIEKAPIPPRLERSARRAKADGNVDVAAPAPLMASAT